MCIVLDSYSFYADGKYRYHIWLQGPNLGSIHESILLLRNVTRGQEETTGHLDPDPRYRYMCMKPPYCKLNKKSYLGGGGGNEIDGEGKGGVSWNFKTKWKVE